ncbi:dual serine/threonine and tyrosine protein kinase [Lingula anatina]|uniref:Dual serine/threonine and tyrosine protein kinase n=1 Tax=Lingula anatina TaxID=7574 RepID=A0A1S3JUT9_LINAN|nr:dual serine/threonine and tyrosine protein kinase [Lingula anatina]|eukprot:XP_013414082.1 dual serine/threonine and tyrosine protein kinase [Lingula anatina]
MAMANFEEGSRLTNLNVIKNEIRALTTDTKEIIRQMSEESGVSYEKLREDIEKVDERINLPVLLLILGRCNSGKSSLANSLLNLCKKARELPTGKTPCTGKTTVVKHGKYEGIPVEGVSDSLAALSIDVENYRKFHKLSKKSLREHITPREKREAEKNIVSIVLTNDFLAEGFGLLDTPGYGETVQIDDDVTRLLNEHCNPIVLYVINGNDGFRLQDKKNIAGIREKLPSVSICYVCTHNDIDAKAAWMNALASEDNFAMVNFHSPEQKMETVKNDLLNGGYISFEDKEDHFFAISNKKIREALKKGVKDDSIRDLEKLRAILKGNLKNRQLESLAFLVQNILDCHNRSFTELRKVCRDMPRDADAIRENIEDLKKMARRWHEQFTELLTKRLKFESIVRDGIATCKSRLSAIVDSSDPFEGVLDPSEIHVDFSNLTQEYSTFLEIFIDRACKCFEDEVRKRIDRLNPQFREELTFDFNAVSSERLKRDIRRIYSLETERNVSKGFEICVSLTDDTFQRLQRGIDQNVRHIMDSISKPELHHYSKSLQLDRDDPKSWQLRFAEKLLETLERSRLAEKLRSHMLGEIGIIWDKLAASLSESIFSDSVWRSRRQERFEKYNASLSVLSARGLSVNFALESCKLDRVVNAHQEQGDLEDGWRRLCTHIIKQCEGHSKVREIKKVHENDVEEQAIQLIYAKDNFPVENENVLKLRGWLMPCSNHIDVITEYFDCDLLEMVAAADDRLTSLHSRIAIARDVAQGMEAMHSVGYIHSDLKPEHIKVAGQRGKISIDCISDPLGTTRLGPPFHVCAEQYENHGRWHSLQKYFFDIFAFGMLLWFLIHGKAARPIEYEHCSDNDDMRAAICRGITPDTTCLDRKSKPLWNLLKDCWTRYRDAETVNAHIAREKLDILLNTL